MPPTPTSRQSLTHKISWSSLASIINLTGRLGVQIALARLLGPDGFGSIAYTIWIIEIVTVITSLGLDKSLTRFLADLAGGNQQQIADTFARWTCKRLMMLMIPALLIGAMFFSVSSPYDHTVENMIIFIILFCFRYLQNINQAWLTGCQRYDTLVKLNTAAALFMLLAIIIGTYYYGINGALAGYTCGAVVPAMYCLTLLRKPAIAAQLPENIQTRIRNYSFNTWVAMIVTIVIGVGSRTEIFFLERFWSEREVGLFTIGLTLTMLVSQTSMLFSRAFLPHFAQLAGSREQQRIADTYHFATRMFALVLFPMAFGIAGLMPVLMLLVFGPEFEPAVPYAVVLAATGAMSFSNIGSSLVYGLERSRFIAVIGGVAAILSLGLSLLVIPVWGAWGAVWARAGVQCSIVLIGMWYIAARLHCPVPLSQLARTMLAAAGCGLTAWWIVRLWSMPWALPVAMFGGFFIYIFALKLLKCLQPGDGVSFEKIIRKMLPPIQKPARAFIQWICLA